MEEAHKRQDLIKALPRTSWRLWNGILEITSAQVPNLTSASSLPSFSCLLSLIGGQSTFCYSNLFFLG